MKNGGNMPDIIDDANIIVEEESAQRLMEIREKLLSGAGLEECEDCGEPIPEGRRQVVPGCTRCVSCQTNFEKKKKS